MLRSAQRLSLALLASSFLAFPAHADAVPPVVDILLKNVERQTNVKPAYDSVKEDGGTITISNLHFDKAADVENVKLKVNIGALTLKGVTDKGGGLFEVANADLSGLAITMR